MRTHTSSVIRLGIGFLAMGATALTMAISAGGISPAFACTPAAGETTCDDTVTVSSTLAGTAASSYDSTAATGTANGTDQNIPFTITATVLDTRGAPGEGQPQWQISAASDGISLTKTTGTVVTPLVLDSATGACQAEGSCVGDAPTDNTGGALTLTATAAPVVTAAANGDFGTVNVTIPGHFAVDANTLASNPTANVTFTFSNAIVTP